jgi:hypothetical protein
MGRRAAAESDRPVQPALLTPGSAIRLPVGYVWVLVLGVLGLTVGGYLLGRSRGIEFGRQEAARTVAAADQAARETARLREPDIAVEPGRAGGVPAGGTTSAGPPAGAGAMPITRTGSDAGGGPSDVLAERRESGKWYFQIITTTYDNAVATARLVSEEGRRLGLDAQVVPGDTDQFATVILLPGFDKASLTVEGEDWWRTTIRELGSRVAGRVAGKAAGKVKFSSTTERPFADAFPRRYP